MSDIRYVLQEYADSVLAYSIDVYANRLETVNLYQENTEASSIGDIFVAKVTHIIKNLNSAFIHYQKGQAGYLPLDTKYPPVMLNRTFDGTIKTGDELLVQMEKEAVRSKDPVFTTNLSIAGKYIVVTIGNKNKSISKKCSVTVREKLLEIIPDNLSYGIIVRTNAEELVLNNCSLSIINDECQQLCAQMDTLLSQGIHRTCYSKVWQPLPRYITELRDMYNIEYSRFVTDSPRLYEKLEMYVHTYAPEAKEKLMLYCDDSYPLHKLYSIETKLNALLKPQVWLKSGAYLIIEKTEAMYVIDVNSGKNISKTANAAFILSINLEAAKEIMYQIRLRNLTGMIVIDFINMERKEDKTLLMEKMRLYARQDRILTTIVDMTALDLVEVTRQKNVKSLAEQIPGKTIDNCN